VRVQAIPLNLNDLERINGGNMMVRHELPYAPGMEVFGVVEAAGAGAEARAGQRVAAMPKGAIGGYAEYAICPSHSAFEMPAAIPLPDAAALYFPFHLAWLGLLDRAALRAGESVLIHAAAGGSGSAAIQLAKHAGARVFATAGGAEKVALCRALGADHAIDYTRDDFAAVVMEQTQNRGVDVVFDNVGAAVFEKSLGCTAYDGRYLMMGFASDKSVLDERSIVPRNVIAANVKLCGVLMAYAPEPALPLMKKGMGWNFIAASRGAEITREIAALVQAKKLRTVIGRVAKFDEIPDAISALANRETMGRTIVMLS
jgi:NADPH2:quinone reductase